MNLKSRPGRRRVAVLLIADLLLMVTAVQAADWRAMPVRRVDNSAINERDRDARTLTPFDQSRRPADIALLAALRRELMRMTNLSITGQNIKIITRQGRVTLRGPVPSQAERVRIERATAHVAGEARIDSQLEVSRAD